MSEVSPTVSLAELAVSYPAASRVFQHYRLDFCCQGERTLAAACLAQDLNPLQVLSEILESQEKPRAWEDATLEELVARVIARYHRTAERELFELIPMARKVIFRHQDKQGCPLGLDTFLTRWAADLMAHMQKEEEILFPMFLRGQGNRVVMPVQVMEAEHLAHGRALQQLRRLTHDFTAPKNACPTWRALYLRLKDFERDLMEHVAFEQEIVFPRGLGQGNDVAVNWAEKA